MRCSTFIVYTLYTQFAGIMDDFMFLLAIKSLFEFDLKLLGIQVIKLVFG